MPAGGHSGNEILQFHCPVVVNGPRVAWAAGKHLVVYNMDAKKFEKDISSESRHTDTIRAIAFSSDGSTVATAGEDKRVVIESSASSEQKEFLHGKKIMALHIDDSNVVIFGDKFGDFYRMREGGVVESNVEVGKAEEEDDDEETSKALELMFGHISAISMSLYSTKRNLLVSADRDEKIRIARYPRADIIESFLLKHRRYVSHLVWGNEDHTVLVSGGADGQIIEWDVSDCGRPKVIRVHQVGLDETGFHTVTCNESGKIFFVTVDDAKNLCVIEGQDQVKKWTMPFEVQTIKSVGGTRLIVIDIHSHMHVIDSISGKVEETVKLTSDVTGVPISYLKLVHHENLNGEERDSKRKKKGGPFS